MLPGPVGALSEWNDKDDNCVVGASSKSIDISDSCDSSDNSDKMEIGLSYEYIFKQLHLKCSRELVDRS